MILTAMTGDELRELQQYNLAFDRERFARMMALKRWRGTYILSHGFPSPEERSARMREVATTSPKKGRPRTVTHQEGPRCRCVACRKMRDESPYDDLRKKSAYYVRF
jgi:hypothetical protein